MTMAPKREMEKPSSRFDPFELIMRKGDLEAMDRMNDRLIELLRERRKQNRKRVEVNRKCESTEVAAINDIALQQDTQQKSENDEIFKPFQLWVRTVRKVRLMTAAYIALRLCATEIGLASAEQTTSDGNDVTSESVKKTRMVNKSAAGFNLAFKPRDFKAAKETRVPAAVVSILFKNPGMRTAEDIAAVEHLMSRLPSFEKYNRRMQLAMCRVIRYFKCEARRVVLRRGHVAYSIYYIYSGSVKVIVDTGHEEADGTPIRYFVPLRKGACFGDVGVIRSVPRTATVVCYEDCEFLVIDKEAYIANGLELLQEQELATRFNFFRKWPPIVRWSDAAIRDLSMSSYTEEFNFNKVVVKDSSKGDMLWFILKGSCDVIRIVDEDVWLTAMSSSEDWNEWTRHYSKANSMPMESTSRIPDILEDRKKASCQFQRERVLEKLAQGLDFDREGYAGCIGGHQNDLQLTRMGSVSPLSFDALRAVRRQSRGKYVRRPLYFIKVGDLTEGECFGLENALPDAKRFPETKERVYVISRGCRIVRLSCSAFRDLVLLLGVKDEALRSSVKTYHENDEIIRWIDDKINWRHFKKDIVERTVVATGTNIKAANFLAHQLSEAQTLGVESPDYSKPFKMIWTGSTLIGPTKNPYHVVPAAEAIARGLTKLPPVKRMERRCSLT